MAWPERIPSGAPSLDLIKVAQLDFEPADTGRYPCLRLAYQAIGAGGTAAAILNAANEVAVQAFLEERLPFPGIPQVIEATLSRVAARPAQSLEMILADDAQARDVASREVALLSRRVSHG